jgi:hypothetical protein
MFFQQDSFLCGENKVVLQSNLCNLRIRILRPRGGGNERAIIQRNTRTISLFKSVIIKYSFRYV